MQAFQQVPSCVASEESATWQPVASALSRVLSGIQVCPQQSPPVPCVTVVPAPSVSPKEHGVAVVEQTEDGELLRSDIAYQSVA